MAGGKIEDAARMRANELGVKFYTPKTFIFSHSLESLPDSPDGNWFEKLIDTGGDLDATRSVV